MTDYVVGHIWRNPYPDGQPYLRIVPGTLDNIDIAFYVADLLANYTGELAGVYVFHSDTGDLVRQERPEPTTDPADYPRIRIAPGSEDGAPPDILAGIDDDDGGLLATATQPPETDPASHQISTLDTDPVNHKEE